TTSPVRSKPTAPRKAGTEHKDPAHLALDLPYSSTLESLLNVEPKTDERLTQRLAR
ncbi:MAG: hypothetical protein ACI8W8_004611, partial [Rhodothermales bacterium]